MSSLPFKIRDAEGNQYLQCASGYASLLGLAINLSEEKGEYASWASGIGLGRFGLPRIVIYFFTIFSKAQLLKVCPYHI